MESSSLTLAELKALPPFSRQRILGVLEVAGVLPTEWLSATHGGGQSATDKIEKIASSKSDAAILDAVRAWCRAAHSKEVEPHTARRLVGGKQKPTKDIQERIKGKARFAKSVAGVQNLLLHDDGAFIPIRAEAPGTYQTV